MSTYTECSDAARRLLDDPGLRVNEQGPEGVFTDMDVVLLAAREASQAQQAYDETEITVAYRATNQILGGWFRMGWLVRFGPVALPGADDLDYLRIEGRVAYARAADGPETITTPNGVFPSMSHRTDPLTRSGRRQGAARNDLDSWAGQDILDRSPAQITSRERTRLLNEVADLRTQLAQCDAEIRQLRAQGMTIER